MKIPFLKHHKCKAFVFLGEFIGRLCFSEFTSATRDIGHFSFSGFWELANKRRQATLQTGHFVSLDPEPRSMSGTEEGSLGVYWAMINHCAIRGQRKPEDYEPNGAPRLLSSRENCDCTGTRNVPFQETAGRAHTEHSQNPGDPRPGRTRPSYLKHFTSIVFIFYYISSYFVCLHAIVHTWRSGHNLWGSVLSFYWGPVDQTQVVKLGNRNL